VTGWIIAAWGVAAGLLLVLLRTRRQLYVSRSSFAALAQRAPVGIMAADTRGECTYANDTWCEISGLSLAETLGRGWARVVHPDDLDAVTAKWQESVRTRQPYLNEVRLVRPDGCQRQVLASGRPTYDDQGRLEGFIGTVLDITVQREAEQQARERESLLQTLIDHSAAAIYLKDAAGRYLLINRRHMELWPAMKAFRPGTTPFEWFPEETARSFIASDDEVIRSGQTRTFEEVITNGDGPRTYLTVKFPVFAEDRQVVAVGGISADITELEQARRDLAERERLLRSLIEIQEKEKQLLCHEFHDGLIQYAVGSKMLLEGMLESNLPEICAAGIGSVIDCLAKGIDEGRRVIRGIRPAALDDLGLRAAVADLVSDLREAGVEVTYRVDPEVDALPAMLQTTVYRVVQESLNNARKHSGSERVNLAVCLTASQLTVTVEDSGCGFNPQVVGGGGFGLVSMRERSRLVGGTWSLESAVGKGTTISVVLPVPATKSVAAGPPAAKHR